MKEKQNIDTSAEGLVQRFEDIVEMRVREYRDLEGEIRQGGDLIETISQRLYALVRARKTSEMLQIIKEKIPEGKEIAAGSRLNLIVLEARKMCKKIEEKLLDLCVGSPASRLVDRQIKLAEIDGMVRARKYLLKYIRLVVC